MNELLEDLMSPQGRSCWQTAQVKDIVRWLNTTMSDTSLGGSFMQTWLVFQVQYYDMPRKPGVRIESPWTLGLKCWAMSFLTQFFNPQQELLGATKFTQEYRFGMNKTMKLCREVMDNCFKNTTYNPKKHKGTWFSKQLNHLKNDHL